jgi:PleD family two-component response regulator
MYRCRVKLATLSGHLVVNCAENSSHFLFAEGKLNYAFAREGRKRIGQTLLDSQLITNHQLKACLDDQKTASKWRKTMYKVLIVENNPIIIKLLSHFFQSEGCDIRLAEDDLQAISVLESFVPDILFTDIIMPEISGDVLCKIVRHTPKFKDIFIVS